MAQIFKPAKKAAKKFPKGLSLQIDRLDYQGQGVASQHKPVVFVEGGLPGETCQVLVKKQKQNYWLAKATKIENASPSRRVPFCDYYGVCGGCQTQHAGVEAMRGFKRASIEHMLKQALGDNVINWQPDIVSEPVGYRRKCRLAIDARNKSSVLLGFRSKDSNRITPVDSCLVLVPELNALLDPIQCLVQQMVAPQRIGHIGLLHGDNITQISLRVVKPLSKRDEQSWIDMADNQGCQLVAEYAEGQSTVLNQHQQPVNISPEHDVHLDAGDNDFIQVNDQVNKLMVQQAMRWMALTEHDHVLDLFCGLGNFSLPMAKRCQSVLGVEGVAKMVQRAEHNALKNGIDNCQFVQSDLAQQDSIRRLSLGDIDKVLLDPARDGAQAVMSQLATLRPSRIVYVSCNPSTFARDVKELSTYKYQLEKVSLMDMFPNTSHTELMALFVPVSDKQSNKA